MTEEAGGKHPMRCKTCDHWKGHYDVPFCKFWDDMIPITKYGVDLIAHVGCASHSSAPQPAPSSHLSAGKADPTRYMSEEQRKYILSFKEEDPLLMAYVEGQKAAEQRIKDVIAELDKDVDEARSYGQYGYANGCAHAISLLRDGGKP